MPPTTPLAAPPTADIGTPDLFWGTQGQGLLTDWWETTADLIWPQSVITYGRMRHDPQIKAVMAAFTLPILRATWLIDPEGCRDEVVQRVSDDLGVGILGTDLKPGPGRRRGVIWSRHLALALRSHLVYGHMPFERRYRIENGQAYLDNLGPRMPWTLARINVARDGLVSDIIQTTQEKPIPASRLVWYVHEQEGANWAGVSALRACFGAWLLKHETWRVHATSIRRFGMGVPGVEAPAGATASQVSYAQQLASAMRAGDQAGMAVPAGFKPFLMGLTGSTPDALGFIRYLDQVIAKQALAGLIELGQTETGSRALGESFLDLFLLALQAIADEVAITATSGHPNMPGIITDLVDQNWGEEEPAPRLLCTDVGTNYEVTADALQKLTVAGALVPDPALDAWIRKMWRIPPRETAWQPMSRGIPAPGAPSGPVKVPGEDLPAPGEPPAAPNPAPPKALPPAPGQPSPAPAAAAPPATGLRRQLTPAEIRAGFQPEDHQQQWASALDNLMGAYKAQVIDAQRRELTDAVTAAVTQGRTDRLALSPPGLYGGPDLILMHMRALADTASTAMLREATHQGVTVDQARVTVDTAKLERAATARAGIAAGWLAQQAGIKALQVAAARTSAELGADAGDAVDSFLGGLSENATRAQLGAALTLAQNAGRTAVMDAAPPATYTATEILDKNTCDPCRAEDGTVFDTLEDAEAAYPTGGYAECEGFDRCRGTVYATWGEETSSLDGVAPLEGDALWNSLEGVATDVSAAEENSAITVWYGRGASDTNLLLRAGEVPTGEQADNIARFTDLISRSPAFSQDAVMWRGTWDADTLFGPVGSKIGDVFTDKGFTSLSADKTVTRGYGNATVKIDVPAGTRALRANPDMFSSAADLEQIAYNKEYTLAPGSRWKITADELIPGKYQDRRQITVTILPPGVTATAVVRAASGLKSSGGVRFAWRAGDIEFGGG